MKLLLKEIAKLHQIKQKSIIYIDTVSKWGRFDIDDVNIGFQDADNIRIRFGNTALGNTTYQTGSVDTGLKKILLYP